MSAVGTSKPSPSLFTKTTMEANERGGGGGGGGGGGSSSFFGRLFKCGKQARCESFNNADSLSNDSVTANCGVTAEVNTAMNENNTGSTADTFIEAVTSDSNVTDEEGEGGSLMEKEPLTVEQMWSVYTASYDFRSVLKTYNEAEKYIKPHFMKFIVDSLEKPIVDKFNKVMRTVKTPAVHLLVDKIICEFCEAMGLTQAKKLPRVEERIFLWFSRHRAQKMLPQIVPQRQIYFINYISWDSMFTDLQCLVSRLRLCSLKQGQIYPDHMCTDEEKIDEVLAETNQSTEAGKPKMVFIEKQTICEHVYASHEFNEPCTVEKCVNYNKRMCNCFQLNVFIQETIVMSTKIKFEEVLNKFRSGDYKDQRWLIRASSVKGGDGVQFIDTADQLESFLRYDIRRRLRGQFFVLQRYPRNPMLLHNRRFDCRMYLLVCCLTDRRVLGFLHPGYVRVAQKNFDSTSNDLRCHLTAPMTWDPDYSRYNSNSEEANDYCIPYFGVRGVLGLPALELISIDSQLAESKDKFLMKLNNIVHQLVKHMESMVQDQPGTWQIFGLDLLVDQDKNPWLMEVMTYPCTGEPDTKSYTQNSILPGMFAEAVSISFELNQRDFYTRQKKEWMNLCDLNRNKPGLITAQRNFLWMYSTEPDKLISYNTPRVQPEMHWYKKWRVTEDFNDYILYLKNYRTERFHWAADDVPFYGRRTFDNSMAHKMKAMLKNQEEAEGEGEGDDTSGEAESQQ